LTTEEAVRGGAVRFVLIAMGGAVSLGLLVVTATVLGVDALRSGPAESSPASAFYLLVGGTFAGILLAGYAAWRLLRLTSVYRRGALSLVSGFATVLLMLICIPVHQLLGRTGLYCLLAVSAGAAALLGSWAESARIRP
jgi:hypothetical protein